VLAAAGVLAEGRAAGIWADEAVAGARSHRRSAPPITHFTPDSLREPLFLNRQRDQTLGGRRDGDEHAAGNPAADGVGGRREQRGNGAGLSTHMVSLENVFVDAPCVLKLLSAKHLNWSMVTRAHVPRQAYFDAVKKAGVGPPSAQQVRKTPSWPRSWTNFSRL
jgi:hypothetical protein